MTRPIIGLLIAVVLVAFTASIYGLLPAVPSPESVLFGEEAATGLRSGPGVFLGPALVLGLWLVLWLFPRVDPWREPGEGGGVSYWIVGNLVILVMATLHLLVVGVTLGWPVDATHLAVVVPGFFFLAVGSYLPTVPANWLLGVRTPWTLRSERVWRETHRLAGWTFVAGGLVLLGAVFLPAEQRPWAALAGLAVAGGVPAAYSYLIWRRVAQ
jgi:uncharacterized membrane protein